MNNPLLSIIIPVYNSEDFIQECISSIQNQNFEDFEIIAVNDGSVDGSEEILENMSEKDFRIRVFTIENNGQANARNHGIRQALGEYITFIDSDDLLDLGTLSYNMNIIITDPSIDFLQYPRKIESADGSFIHVTPQKEVIVKNDDFFVEWIERKLISWLVCDKIFKRESIKNVNFEFGMVYEDNYFISEILNIVNKAYISSKGCYIYKFNNNSTTRTEHSLKKDLDTQKVNLNILKKAILRDEPLSLRLNIFCRTLNVYLSLIKSFNQKNLCIDPILTSEIHNYSHLFILKSNLNWKCKLRITYFKLFRKF
ncbi:glycosyltransferase family 2 protein [Lentiprolixibacter aurantiacus]|uniref:Glycosyltransferase n=1 Tax=Lentiprolixibacter aurantiacus TaxID=2993939 RepID=A0AAE3MLA0_9FLAO|nr:glycosyltransferase family 2 protein [Lentiprolixibacter aurantiacus]MCX2719855.1 glycosyltransferase [Lentiprolixibacter aurantiacus]